MKQIITILILIIALQKKSFAQCPIVSPIVISSNGQVVEDVKIVASNSNAITINGFSDVIIRNCEIEYTGPYHGINFFNADNLRIENTSVTYTNAPQSGALPNANRNCIDGFKSQNIIISNVRLEDGSTGIRLNQCDNSLMQFIEGYNFRGPFPRGQLVQFDKCIGGTLQDFSVINDSNISWTEDNVSIFKSGGQVIQRGFIDGNNSPSGVGILFEDQSEPDARGGIGGTVKDIDLINMGNGACSSVDGAGNVTFENIRIKQMICTDQGRGLPKSGALPFSGFGTEEGLGGNKIVNSIVFDPCKGEQTVYPTDKFEVIEIETDEDFTPRTPIKAVLSQCNTLGTVNFNSYKKGQLNFYPNPAKDKIYVSSGNKEKTKELKIVDTNGKVVLKNKLNFGSKEIDVSTLSSGVYFVLLKTNSEILASKMIKSSF